MIAGTAYHEAAKHITGMEGFAMKNDDQRDDRLIKDKWFDDYCFYKLVIEDEQEPRHQHTDSDAGCGFVVAGTLIAMIILDAILKAL